MWSNDGANTTTLTNDSPSEKSSLTIDDMDITIDEAGGSLDDPRSPWKKDSANTSTLTNDSANA